MGKTDHAKGDSVNDAGWSMREFFSAAPQRILATFVGSERKRSRRQVVRIPLREVYEIDGLERAPSQPALTGTNDTTATRPLRPE